MVSASSGARGQQRSPACGAIFGGRSCTHRTREMVSIKTPEPGTHRGAMLVLRPVSRSFPSFARSFEVFAAPPRRRNGVHASRGQMATTTALRATAAASGFSTVPQRRGRWMGPRPSGPPRDHDSAIPRDCRGGAWPPGILTAALWLGARDMALGEASPAVGPKRIFIGRGLGFHGRFEDMDSSSGWLCGLWIKAQERAI